MRVRTAGAQISVELVESWLRDARAYRFRTEHTDFPFLSQGGFDALRAGECDIACTDRLITPRELGEFGETKLEGYRVAFYGYALYVHPSNRLDSIFAGHIRLVFRNLPMITDWKQLAGEPIAELEGPINLYGPLKNSRAGLIVSRQAQIWFADPTWTALETDAEILERVATDPYALGFASLGYEGDVRPLGIRMRRTGRPAFPSLDEIENESYGLAKVIYVYFRTPASPEVNAVIEFLFSAAGRAAIESTDVWPIAWERADATPER